MLSLFWRDDDPVCHRKKENFRNFFLNFFDNSGNLKAIDAFNVYEPEVRLAKFARLYKCFPSEVLKLSVPP